MIGGTNDYRYILDPEGTRRAGTCRRTAGRRRGPRGCCRHRLGGIAVPSGGDPVVRFDDANCAAYAGDLNYTSATVPGQLPERHRALPLGRGDAQVVSQRGSDPSCWPTSIFAATASDNHHFLDKEWFDVGVSGGETVVWVTWSDFLTPDPAVPEAFTASIWASRCDAALTACEAPIDISGADEDIQFSYVTIGPEADACTSRGPRSRASSRANPRRSSSSSASWSPARRRRAAQVVETLTEADRVRQHAVRADELRVADGSKNAVKMVGGEPRIYVTWEECSSRPLGFYQNLSVWVAWSDDQGASWDTTKVSALAGTTTSRRSRRTRETRSPRRTLDEPLRLGIPARAGRGARPDAQRHDARRDQPAAAHVAVEQPERRLALQRGRLHRRLLRGGRVRGRGRRAHQPNYQPIQFLGGPPGKAESQQDNYLYVRTL